MLIVGFGSKCRQGKDLAVQAVIDYYNDLRAFVDQDPAMTFSVSKAPTVQRIGFADALYEVCRNEYGMKEKDPALLQRIGMERRVQNPMYWIEKAFKSIDKRTSIVLISDVRYQNEAAYIKEQRGFVVNVTRLNADGSRFIASDRPANHPSEVDLDNYNFDFRLINSNGHQALLADQAITLVEYLRGLHV